MLQSEYGTGSTDCGNVIIEITASQRDMADISLFENRNTVSEAESIQEAESYTMNCIGTLTGEDGRVYLRYCEPGDKDSAGASAEISFLENEPDCITVQRTGESSSAFVIKEATRHMSVYGTPYGPIEMCVFARKVRNSITAESGGELEMDYTVELRGLTAQRTKMTVKAKQLDVKQN